MKILFSHVNFPSQFRRLSFNFQRLGHDVVFVAQNAEWHAPSEVNYSLKPYETPKSTEIPQIHPYLRRLNKAISQGQAVYRHCDLIKSSGWQPDVVISHVGFGNGLFLKDLFPDSYRIGLVEWFYNAYGSDVDFFSPRTVPEDHKLCLRIWNSETLLECSTLDKIVTPTEWQRAQFPRFLRDHIDVIHEGIDTDVDISSLKTQPYYEYLVSITRGSSQILTYVSRCFEDYRGFSQFIEIVSLLQRSNPDVHVLLVGSDCTAYGSPRPDGTSWSDWARQRSDLDFTRIHFLGSLQTAEYHCVLAISTVHSYLTIPFILSWSFLEAMSFGCAIVASNTAPVQEVMTHGTEGLLVDFFDTRAHSDSILRLLSDQSLRSRLAKSARQRALAYSSARGLEAWTELLPRVPVDGSLTKRHI